VDPIEECIALPAPTPAWTAALSCLTRLKRAGFQAWFVGGAVRDLLLGRPLHDVDCCTDAEPAQVEALFPGSLGVGRQFGVIVVPAGGGVHTEVASFRSDLAYIDGRRPSGIRPASEAEDVQRRDFTINALLLDPESGLLRDHVGGLADLRARRLRCIGAAQARLQEDRLRVLRAWRFAAHYDLVIEPATLAALEETGLGGVSRERLLQEWGRGLGHERGWAWWNRFRETPQRPLFCPLAPPVAEACWQPPLAADAVLGSVLCLRDLDPSVFAGLVAALPWSRQQARRLNWLHGALARRGDPERLVRLRDQHHAWSEDLAALIAALAADPAEAASCGAWLAGWAEERERPLPPLCDGEALIALGLAPGPALGQALAALAEAQLLGQLTRPEQVPAHLVHLGLIKGRSRG
jgi:poly(A) polymerase